MYVSLWKRAALFVACFGMIVPQGALVAAEPASQHQTARMLDVALTSGGTLSGQVVDAQGKLIEGAVVAVRFQNRVVAKTTTDAEGRYAVRGRGTLLDARDGPSGRSTQCVDCFGYQRDSRTVWRRLWVG